VSEKSEVMTVRKLIEILKTLNPDMEIRHDSYEFAGDFPIVGVQECEYDGHRYYNITDYMG